MLDEMEYRAGQQSVNANSLDFIEDKIYIVKFDGVEYETVCRYDQFSSAGYSVGNHSLHPAEGYLHEDNGLPFLVYTQNQNRGVYVFYSNNKPHTVGIFKTEENIKPLQEKYLPEHEHEEYLKELPEHTHDFSELTGTPEFEGGGAGTWDELEGKPFITNIYNSVVWNEPTSDVMVGNYYLVNDVAPVAVCFANGYQCNVATVMPTGIRMETHRCTAADVVERDGILQIAYVGIVVYEDGQVYDGNTFQKKGLYFKKDGSTYPVTISIPNFKGFISEKLRIDRLPEHTHPVRWEDVKDKPEVFGEAEVFYARYGETTYEEIVEAFDAGKFICATKNDGRVWAPLQSLVLDGRALFSAVQGAIVHTYECNTESVWIENLNAFAVQNHTHPSEVFYATYNVTSLAEIEEAYNAGKAVICKFSNGMYNANLSMFMAGGMAIFTLFQDGTAKVMKVSSSDEWSTTNLKLAKEEHNHDGVYAPAEHSHELPEHLQFGETVERTVIFEGSEVIPGPMIADGEYMPPSDSIFVDGEYYIVTVDGVEYEPDMVTSVMEGDGYSEWRAIDLFADSSYGNKDWSKWPISLSSYNGGVYVDYPDADDYVSHSVKIEHLKSTVKTIDTKFLPEHTHDMTEEINLALAEAKASGEFKGDKGDPGEPGSPGTPGHTPVKGTDYYTPADKSEMVNMVLSALPTWSGGEY